MTAITPEDHPDQWAKGSRFLMMDDAGTEPAYFPAFADAVDAAFNALAADVLAEIENAQ